MRLKKRYYLITPTEDEGIFNALPRILLSWGLPNIEENYEVKGDIEPADSQDEQKLDNQKIRVKNSTGLHTSRPTKTDKEEDEKSLAKIIEDICIIYKKQNEPLKSAPSILQSVITALNTSQEECLSHLVSMLDAENLKFPMISEDECKQFGDQYYDSKGNVYPIHIKNDVKFNISNSLGVFKRVLEHNEKYAIRQKRVCIKMKHPSILDYWGFAYKEEKGLRKVTGLLMEHLSLRPENSESCRIKEKAVTLAMFLERRSYYLGNSERIENWRVYEFALQLSDALMYCHETAGIIYRSLGPRSVLIYDHCNKLKLYDFTLSREPVPVDGTRRLGAPGFQAPEMMDTLDKDSYGYNVDCWSYAMMIFFIIRNGEKHVNDTSMIYPFNGADYKTTTCDDIEKMLRRMQKSRDKESGSPSRLADDTFNWDAKHFFEDKLLCSLEMGPPNEEDATAPNTGPTFQCPKGRETVYKVMRRCLALDPNRRPSMAEIHVYLEKNRPPQ